MEFTRAGVPTLSVQGIIKHVIEPVNAGAEAPPFLLCSSILYLAILIRHSINAVNPMIQNLKQHISQLQIYNNIPRYRILLGEKAPEGQNPQLFLLPT